MTQPNGLRIDGLIFDIDGTVADNLPQVFDAFRAGFTAGGTRHYSDEDIYGMFGPSPEELFQRALRENWETAVERFYDHYRSVALPHQIVVPSLADTLSYLAGANVRLGVVSGGSARLVALTLELLGLQDRFSHIAANGIPAKPKRDHLLSIAGQWSLPNHRLAYIGDSPNDMEHAAAAGMVPLGAAWAHASRPGALRAAGAAVVFRHPAELQAWLTRMTTG